MLQQKTACRDRKWGEYDKFAETKKIYVATRLFVNRMSTPRRTYRNKEAPVATNEPGRKQKFCREKVSSVMTRN